MGNFSDAKTEVIDKKVFIGCMIKAIKDTLQVVFYMMDANSHDVHEYKENIKKDERISTDSFPWFKGAYIMENNTFCGFSDFDKPDKFYMECPIWSDGMYSLPIITDTIAAKYADTINAIFEGLDFDTKRPFLNFDPEIKKYFGKKSFIVKELEEIYRENPIFLTEGMRLAFESGVYEDISGMFDCYFGGDVLCEDGNSFYNIEHFCTPGVAYSMVPEFTDEDLDYVGMTRDESDVIMDENSSICITRNSEGMDYGLTLFLFCQKKSIHEFHALAEMDEKLMKICNYTNSKMEMFSKEILFFMEHKTFLEQEKESARDYARFIERQNILYEYEKEKGEDEKEL